MLSVRRPIGCRRTRRARESYGLLSMGDVRRRNVPPTGGFPGDSRFTTQVLRYEPRPDQSIPGGGSVGGTNRPASGSSSGSGKVPQWCWWALGGLVLAIGLAVLIELFFKTPGYTLTLVGAPPASEAYINGARVGVETGDGSIRIAALAPGVKQLVVRCAACEDFQSQENIVDDKTVQVVMQCGQSEIEYKGPMILIRGGQFLMGVNDANWPDQGPQSMISLPDFYIDKFETTNADYRRFCEETRRKLPTPDQEYADYFSHPDWPVVGISWFDAREYCKHRNKRLVTEEEWEKAASWDEKNKKKVRFPWGDKESTELANISGTPVPVQTLPEGRSPYGVFNLAGNASEWVEDYYHLYSGGTVGGQSQKVIRGSGFLSTASAQLANINPVDVIRTTFREHLPPEKTPDQTAATSVGCRCAVSADDPLLKDQLRSGQRKNN